MSSKTDSATPNLKQLQRQLKIKVVAVANYEVFYT